jgi:HSP20 family protein
VEGDRQSIQELLRLQERMNRLFEESMGRHPVTDGSGGPCWSPAVDVYELEDAVVFEAELPGVVREDVRIAVEDGSLILRGERRVDPKLRSRDFHRMERAYGPFERRFRLPPEMDPGAIEAELQGGILRVTVPRRADGGRTIRIALE